MTLAQVMELKMGNGNNVKVARNALTALATQLESGGDLKEVVGHLRSLATRGQKVEGEKKGKKEKKADAAPVAAAPVPPTPPQPEEPKAETKPEPKVEVTPAAQVEPKPEAKVKDAKPESKAK